MSHSPARCEHDSIKWFPRSVIAKYSPDQSEFAERKLREELSWGRRLLVSRFGVERIPGRPLLVPVLHGDWLRDIFPAGPEDGFAYTAGNILVNGGLDALGLFISGTPGPQLTNTHAICGVGSGTTAAAVTQTALIADGTAPNGTTGAWYQAHDATYPKVDGSVHGQLDGQATVTGSNGNLNWQEWCWATATGTTGANTGSTLSTLVATSTQVMFNRWTGTSLGTKGSGATWVFSTTITFSLSQVRSLNRTKSRILNRVLSLALPKWLRVL